MTNQDLAVLAPESLVFLQDNDLLTTSLKIAEVFGKQHKNVIRDIERIIEQISGFEHKLKFELMQIDVEIGNGAIRKDKAYQMNQDGLVLVVMGYTGEAAMKIKVAYINAFNFMRSKLFPPAPTQYALKALPPATPKTLTEAMIRQVQNKAAQLFYEKEIPFQITYRKIKNTFQVGTYKNVPFHRYLELCKMLEIEPLQSELELEEMIWVKKSELISLQEKANQAPQQRIEAVQTSYGLTIPAAQVIKICNETSLSDVAVIPKRSLLELRKVLESINFENIEL